MLKEFKIFDKKAECIENKKMTINTINAYSYNVSRKDPFFKEALMNSGVLIPDGIGVVFAMRVLKGVKIKKFAGEDLFTYEMKRLQDSGGSCFFLGSTNETLEKIEARASIEYPNVKIKTFSPPYQDEFSEEENELMINEINEFEPDVLLIGMTAPKQEKWAYSNMSKINAGHICSIGAVFDFYAGNIKRAPSWVINCGLEWFYRFAKEPRRLWRRYLLGNGTFVYYILKEKFKIND